FRMSAQDSYADKANRYVQQYGKLAVAEQKRSGVPAAVTLGQGILETQAGCSELVTGANNHFGIKCKSGWTGETFAHTDDAPDECFRKYKCCEDSYKDHSDYLKGTPRYASLFRLSVTDYAGWAYGLKKCGYATNPHYAQQLIKIIEDFHLQAYTYAAIDNSGMPASDLAADDKTDINVKAPANNATYETAAPAATATVTTVTPIASKKKQGKEVITPYSSAPAKGVLLKVNGLRAFYALKGDMLLQYALKFNVRYEHLLEINDLKDAPLPASMFVYLEKKNYRGVRPMHTVKQGENLLMISQAEGIQLRRLMTLNKLTIYGEEPVPGAILHLQDAADTKPAV
ncbi:MAG: glucosaminidase domain-containing protein, partial [Bacteroidetes bacterium]|nr:glucosaminidase domain-containing protein [Bacteroidota bacterium]